MNSAFSEELIQTTMAERNALLLYSTLKMPSANPQLKASGSGAGVVANASLLAGVILGLVGMIDDTLASSGSCHSAKAGAPLSIRPSSLALRGSYTVLSYIRPRWRKGTIGGRTRR
jgi:hypothetical protein